MMETELIRYGYLFIVIGTIVEGDATLLTAAFLAHRGYFSLSWVLTAATLSTSVASFCYFLIAMRAGSKWMEAAGGNSARMERVLGWSRNWGGLLLLASRFMPGFRTLIPIACGVTRMDVVRFFGWNAAGAALWAGLFGLAGYLGGHVATIAFEDIRRHERLLAAVIAAATAGDVLWRTRAADLIDIWFLSMRWTATRQTAGKENRLKEPYS